MPTEKHQKRLARWWAVQHYHHVAAIGLRSIQDPISTCYTLGPLTFVVFDDEPTRQAYLHSLYLLAVRRHTSHHAQFVVDEHTRRLRRWCREQIALSLDRRSTVMVEASTR